MATYEVNQMSHTLRDKRKKGNFSQLDNEVLDMGLDANAIAVYFVLVRLAGPTDQAWPGTKTIGKMVKIKSRTTVVKALQELEDAGLIAIETQTDDSGYQISNRYTILPVKKAEYA